jgi:hypothetical protein
MNDLENNPKKTSYRQDAKSAKKTKFRFSSLGGLGVLAVKRF